MLYFFATLLRYGSCRVDFVTKNERNSTTKRSITEPSAATSSQTSLMPMAKA